MTIKFLNRKLIIFNFDLFRPSLKNTNIRTYCVICLQNNNTESKFSRTCIQHLVKPLITIKLIIHSCQIKFVFPVIFMIHDYIPKSRISIEQIIRNFFLYRTKRIVIMRILYICPLNHKSDVVDLLFVKVSISLVWVGLNHILRANYHRNNRNKQKNNQCNFDK